MLATCATESDSEIAAVIRDEAGQPLLYKTADVFAHILYILVAFEKLNHRRIASG